MWGKKGELEIWLTLRSFRTLSEGIKKFFKIFRARILDRLANDIYKLDVVLPELIRVFNSQVFRVRSQ